MKIKGIRPIYAIITYREIAPGTSRRGHAKGAP